MVELAIIKGEDIYFPSVLDGITWETERKGSPGILKFTVVNAQNPEFEEGNIVRLVMNSTPVFFGYVFKKKEGQATPD